MPHTEVFEVPFSPSLLGTEAEIRQTFSTFCFVPVFCNSLNTTICEILEGGRRHKLSKIQLEQLFINLFYYFVDVVNFLIEEGLRQNFDLWFLNLFFGSSQTEFGKRLVDEPLDFATNNLTEILVDPQLVLAHSFKQVAQEAFQLQSHLLLDGLEIFFRHVDLFLCLLNRLFDDRRMTEFEGLPHALYPVFNDLLVLLLVLLSHLL